MELIDRKHPAFILNLQTMNFLLTCFFVLIVSISASAQPGNDFKLPQTWEKDFIISLSFSGSMRGGSTDITCTYDSCKYVSSLFDKGPKEKKYLLKEADRTAILKKLQELKADEIKAESGMQAVDDGWSQSICLGFYCIEGGTSAEMSEKDKHQFHEVYNYLEEFAMKKRR
jgi:hypothetical protein